MKSAAANPKPVKITAEMVTAGAMVIMEKFPSEHPYWSMRLAQRIFDEMAKASCGKVRISKRYKYQPISQEEIDNIEQLEIRPPGPPGFHVFIFEYPIMMVFGDAESKYLAMNAENEKVARLGINQQWSEMKDCQGEFIEPSKLELVACHPRF